MIPAAIKAIKYCDASEEKELVTLVRAYHMVTIASLISMRKDYYEVWAKPHVHEPAMA